jgi:transposase
MILAQRALLEQEQSARIMAESEAKVRALEIERLKLLLAKARREQFGQSSERGKLLIEQLELAIEDLEETQAEEEARAAAGLLVMRDRLRWQDSSTSTGDLL